MVEARTEPLPLPAHCWGAFARLALSVAAVRAALPIHPCVSSSVFLHGRRSIRPCATLNRQATSLSLPLPLALSACVVSLTRTLRLTSALPSFTPCHRCKQCWVLLFMLPPFSNPYAEPVRIQRHLSFLLARASPPPPPPTHPKMLPFSLSKPRLALPRLLKSMRRRCTSRQPSRTCLRPAPTASETALRSLASAACFVRAGSLRGAVLGQHRRARGDPGTTIGRAFHSVSAFVGSFSPLARPCTAHLVRSTHCTRRSPT